MIIHTIEAQIITKNIKLLFFVLFAAQNITHWSQWENAEYLRPCTLNMSFTYFPRFIDHKIADLEVRNQYSQTHLIHHQNTQNLWQTKQGD